MQLQLLSCKIFYRVKILTFGSIVDMENPHAKISITDKEEFLRTVWLHYVFFAPHAELQQLSKGFRETLDVSTLCILHSKQMWGLLAASPAYEVTASQLIDSFLIKYSEQGSNKRTSEEAIMLHWADFLQD